MSAAIETLHVPVEAHGVVVVHALGAAAYSGYVAWMVPGIAVPVLALAVGLAALFVFDRQRVAWCASHAAVLSVLHLRSLPAGAPFEPIQLGLAAFVLASAAMTSWPYAVPRWAIVVPIAVAALVAFPGGIVGGMLAAARPLSALEVIITGRTKDRWLVWSPVVSAARGGR